ncbi:MAG TPA: ATP-binding protein, partial [Thermomicrobiaceae bacterium]|nr:ATP-binding protein [Thermomicrobiaceae bacterium]
EMWEKIVLNLLSNAFKFTFDGEITVSLRPSDDGGSVQLSVSDTGTGIPAEELPHLFERFRRVQGAESRTHEGTGIGLALVQELVKLHGGDIAVESEVGRGTTFTVTIASGRAHLPVDRVRTERALISSTIGAAPFVEEALSWLPDEAKPAEFSRADSRDEPGLLMRPADQPAVPARLLLADDNADMRAYLLQLLSPRYEVEAVSNGSTALAAAIERLPDLVLADVMMPGLDGFELLSALRSEPATREVPVVLLSARAGEEAKIEGLQAGADDYLVKPFSARELLARVDTHIELARVRAESAARERTVRLEAEGARRLADLARQAHDEVLTETAHDLRAPLTVVKGRAELLRRQAERAGVDGGDGRFIDGLRNIVDAAAQIEAQIEALLDTARLRAGQLLDLNPQPMDLVALASRIARQQQQTTDRHRVAVETTESSLPGVWDSARLARLLNNLVSNAIKYSPAGGLVTISVERERASSDNWATLRVSDQGVGIPAGDLPGVFERFQRASNIGQIAGTGIGLASVRQIAEQHGGSVSVESEVGQGSVFTVRLPISLTPGPSPTRGEGRTEEPSALPLPFMGDARFGARD